MSIVLQGSTSGSVTLQEPAIAGTTVLTLPATSGTLITTASSGQSIPKAALPTGSVLQVVQGTYSTVTSTSGTTLIDTGVTATITPTSSSSKIFVLVTMNGLYNANVASVAVKLAILRNSTNLNAFCNYTNFITTTAGLLTSASSNYLDSPATTSATIYKVQFARVDGSGTVGVQWNSDFSSITLLEIAA
jgi:hypothetical protein